MRAATLPTQKAVSELPFASISKQDSGRNHSHENVFLLQKYRHAIQAQIHIKGFATLEKVSHTCKKAPHLEK